MVGKDKKVFMSDPPRSTHPSVLAGRTAARQLDGRGVAGRWPGGRTTGRWQGDGAVIGLRLSGRVVSQRKGIGLDGVKAVKLRVGGRATTTGGMAVELQVTGKVTAQQLQYDLAKGRQQGNMSAEGRHLGGRAAGQRPSGHYARMWLRSLRGRTTTWR